MTVATRFIRLLITMMVTVSAVVSTARTFSLTVSQADKPEADEFVYANFEKMENGRPVSNGGGLVQIYTAQESTPVQFKGLANASPGAPEIVRVKGQEENHVATFEYTLVGPNQWANVTLEIQGHPNKEGKAVADDVSAYKNL